MTAFVSSNKAINTLSNVIKITENRNRLLIHVTPQYRNKPGFPDFYAPRCVLVTLYDYLLIRTAMGEG